MPDMILPAFSASDAVHSFKPLPKDTKTSLFVKVFSGAQPP